MVDEVRALLLIGRDGQQVFHQQGFVAGGCNLGNKDHIVLVCGRLGLVGQVRVDGVAHLMHEREHVVERALEVEQYIRMHARACRVGARALALVLVHVDPAVGKAFAEQIQVVLTERRERLQCDLLGLLEREFHLHAVHDRHIQVVHVQLVHAEQLLSQRNIAVHGRKRAVYCIDQIAVNLGRHLVAVERGIQCRGIFSHVREKQQLLKLRGQRCRRGVAELVVHRVQRIERGLSQHTVVGLHQRDERAVRDRMRDTVLVHRVREFEVSVVEHGVNVIRAGGHFACSGEDCLLLVGQHMLSAAANAVDIQAVQLQLGCFGVQTVHVFIADGEQLRGLKRGGRLNFDREARHLADHLLIGGYAGVLIAAALRVVYERVKCKADFIIQTEKRQQNSAAFGQSAAECGDARNELLGLR